MACVCDKIVDGLSDFGLIGSKKVDFTLNAKVVASGHAGLSILALTDKEGEIRVGALHILVVIADERSIENVLVRQA